MKIWSSVRNSIRVFLRTISLYLSGELEQDIDTWILIGDPSRKHPSVHCKRYVAIFNTANSIYHGRRLSRKHPSVHCKRYVAIFNTAGLNIPWASLVR